MLSTKQIWRALANDTTANKYFIGVFPSDKLPESPPIPSCFVFNTDPSDKPGQHWVAMFIDEKKTCEYFDSFGIEPNLPAVTDYIKNNCVGLWHNATRVQSHMTAACGAHCIYYLLMRCRNVRMSSPEYFISQPFQNDCFVTEFINKHCNMKTEVFDEKILVEQLCVILNL